MLNVKSIKHFNKIHGLKLFMNFIAECERIENLMGFTNYYDLEYCKIHLNSLMIPLIILHFVEEKLLIILKTKRRRKWNKKTICTFSHLFCKNYINSLNSNLHSK